MNINQLNAQITIKDVHLTRDPLGGNSESETVAFSGVWANVKNIKGVNVYQSKQREARAYYMITIRYRTGVSPLMRVYGNFGSLIIMNIVDVDNKHEWLELHCENLKSNGV